MIDLCSNAGLGFCVLSTEGKISLSVPIHMRVSVCTCMHGHVNAMDRMYVWEYMFVNMDVCVNIVACGCICSFVWSIDAYMHICMFMVGVCIYVYNSTYIFMSMGMYIGYIDMNTFLHLHV